MKTKQSIEIQRTDGPKEILRKLNVALQADGDFPVRAKAVNELRSLVNRPNTPINNISEVILRESSLATRVLHVVNSAYYQRSTPITTVSQAVMQIGMRPLSELFTGLVLLQKFIPAAERGGIFADNLKRCILTSLITSYIGKKDEEEGLGERGYLAGTFFNLGYLILSYYFPQVFETASKRAVARYHDVVQSLTEILGVQPLDLRLSVVETLDIPEYYRGLIARAHQARSVERSADSDERLVDALCVADKLASGIITLRSREEFFLSLSSFEKTSALSTREIHEIVTAIPELFREHCKMIDLGFLTLPEWFTEISVPKPAEIARPQTKANDTANNTFMGHADEIREAIKNGEPLTGIIASVMETIAFFLKFDRVLLLMANDSRNELVGKMALGQKLDFDPRSIKRSLKLSTESADFAAFTGGSPRIFGDPVFENGWPFAAIPVGGSQNRAIGVIYADRISADDPDAAPLDAQVQASLSVLTDLLDEAVGMNQ